MSNLYKNLKKLELFEGVLRDVKKTDKYAYIVGGLSARTINLTELLNEDLEIKEGNIKDFFNECKSLEEEIDQLLEKEKQAAGSPMPSSRTKDRATVVLSICAILFTKFFGIIIAAISLAYGYFKEREECSSNYGELLSQLKTDIGNLERKVARKIEKKKEREKQLNEVAELRLLVNSMIFLTDQVQRDTNYVAEAVRSRKARSVVQWK